MSAAIAYLIIGIVSATGFLVDVDLRRFDADRISDWFSMSIVFLLIVLTWPYFYYEKCRGVEE